MKGHRTTFLELFDSPHDGRPAITKIVIPIIQRDFAQGRLDAESTLIRERFVTALVGAATSSHDMGLDFIYGDVKDGALRPLDGQQRLTTLYLLHWYVASRADTWDKDAVWLRFFYVTRPSARDFTETLAQYPYRLEKLPESDLAQTPAEWITNQHWYQYPWDHDPTIKAMLVMLDAIHARFEIAPPDFRTVWDRLAERSTIDTRGAIWFDFLRVNTELGDDLYIKSNSRGKPLTKFEVFKADLEGAIKEADDTRYQKLAKRLDGDWTDLLWRYEKKSAGDYKIDDEFMNYMRFIIEICEWRDAAPERKWDGAEPPRLLLDEERARLAFADPGNQNAERNRDFLFHAFDTWHETDPSAELGRLFAAGGLGEGPLPLFSSTPDLFGACIAKYGSNFSVQETLLLFAVLLAREATSALDPHDFARRLRTLRNLTAADLDRDDRSMSRYVASTERLIREDSLGALDGLEGLRRDWVADEALKWRFVEEHPALIDAVHELEDNRLTRGCIMAFDLDPSKLVHRAKAFSRISESKLRDLFGAALLTKGDYSRDLGWHGGRRRQIGSSRSAETWTEMLTIGSRDRLEYLRVPLTALLDDFSQRSAVEGGGAAVVLDQVRTEWLAAQQSRRHYDWRYYLARYSGARTPSDKGYCEGRYDAKTGGFGCGHLNMLHGFSKQGNLSDVLLLAAWVEGALQDVAKQPTGRWEAPGLTLRASRVEIRCDDDAFVLKVPEDDQKTRQTVVEVLTLFGTGDSFGVPIEQGVDGIDAEDRVQLCVRLVRALAAAGL